MAAAAILSSLVLPRQGCSNGTSQHMIHSPPLSIKRVSWKLSRAQRMAAQEAGAFKPTPVTMPVPVIAMGKLLMESSHLI